MKNVEFSIKNFKDKFVRDKSFLFVNKLQKAIPGADIYLVGGIIRDKFLGIEAKDFDFVVGKVSANDLSKFLSKLGKVDYVGKNFGVFKFKPKGSKALEPFDIALPRSEKSVGVGHRAFSVKSDPNLPIEKDLSRRDFTINALALNLKNYKLVDPFDGMADLKKGIIRAVGNPRERFKEDYIRILRAIRFAAQLKFKIEKETYRAMVKDSKKVGSKVVFRGEKINVVPEEMISQELLKTLNLNPVLMLDYYDKTGLMKKILPEVEKMKGIKQPPEFHREGDVFEHTKIAIALTPKTSSIRLKLAVLLHDVGKPSTMKTPLKHKVSRIRFNGHDREGEIIVKKIGKRLRFPNKLVDEVSYLVKTHMFFISGEITEMRPRTIKKYFLDNPELGDELLDLYRIDVSASENRYRNKNLKNYRRVRKYIENMRKSFKVSRAGDFSHIINGNDIMKEFKIPASPEVGKYLEQASGFILKFVTKNKKSPSKKEVIAYLKSK